MASETQSVAVPAIVIEPHEWLELAAILRQFAPNQRIFAFGSRATGNRVRRFSDLDLVIDGEPLTLGEAGLLDEALEESRLPFKVDVTQMSWLTPDFRARIEGDMVLVRDFEQDR